MRVAVVFFSHGSDAKLQETAKALSKGIAAQGHEVDVIDGRRESGKKLTFYEYIAFGTENINFFGGKIPGGVQNYLRQAGSVTGKRSFAFVIKKGLRPMKTLSVLMRQMESEGMFLKISDVISRGSQAEEIGKRLQIKRS